MQQTISTSEQTVKFLKTLPSKLTTEQWETEIKQNPFTYTHVTETGDIAVYVYLTQEESERAYATDNAGDRWIEKFYFDIN